MTLYHLLTKLTRR